MTDTTVKTEFIKVDAPDGYEKDLYVNGEQKERCRRVLQSVKETRDSGILHVNVRSGQSCGYQNKESFSDWSR